MYSSVRLRNRTAMRFPAHPESSSMPLCSQGPWTPTKQYSDSFLRARWPVLELRATGSQGRRCVSGWFWSTCS